MRALLYPIPAVPVPGEPPAGFEEVVLRSAAGDRLHGWHRPASDPGRPAVVFFHGNGENLGTLARSGTLEELSKLGASALVLDYPGYGRSSGRPSEEGIVAAGAAALDWLTAQHPRRPLVAMGWSLGAAVAVQLAATGDDLDGLVVLSPWCSLEEVARAHYPGWMVQLFLRERYDSLSAAGGVRAAILVLHGEE
ncbi:MAG: alpha/beta hydrolase, partial [Thermoanaerobaculia bacterium]